MATCPFSHMKMSDPTTYRGPQPLASYQALREEAPVAWHQDPVWNVDFWTITKREHLDLICKQPNLFSAEAQSVLPMEMGDDVVPFLRNQLVNMDPPKHIKYRKLVDKAFKAKAVSAYEPRFREVVRESIAAVIDKGECDFVAAISSQLPLIAICELMGVPIEDRNLFFEWTDKMIAVDDPDSPITQDDATGAMMEMFVYGGELAAKYRENPADNLLTAMLNATVDGEKLTEEEFQWTFLMLFFAGNETTRNAATHGMRLLMEHPEQYRMLVDNPALIPDAVEEILRFNSPVISMRRTATDDVEVGGQQIRKGDKIIMLYQAINRDAAVFEQADDFDITRSQREDVRREHRTFGIGEHFCLGSHLARLELQIIFEEVTASLRNPEPTGEAEYLASWFVHGIKHLPIRFEKAPAI